jgi:hypothetical protein
MFYNYHIFLKFAQNSGGLAQLARAFDWQSKGQEFDSPNLHNDQGIVQRGCIKGPPPSLELLKSGVLEFRERWKINALLIITFPAFAANLYQHLSNQIQHG